MDSISSITSPLSQSSASNPWWLNASKRNSSQSLADIIRGKKQDGSSSPFRQSENNQLLQEVKTVQSLALDIQSRMKEADPYNAVDQNAIRKDIQSLGKRSHALITRVNMQSIFDQVSAKRSQVQGHASLLKANNQSIVDRFRSKQSNNFGFNKQSRTYNFGSRYTNLFRTATLGRYA